MKKLFLLLAVFACLTVEAQEFLAQPPENMLPSEVAAQNITELTSAPRPDLRRGPDEPGYGNKETWLPVAAVDYTIILSMSILLFGYSFFKTRKNERTDEKI
ncbi:hypothetical protein [Viscerimonas tarda]